ncbi:hypothetical protein Tco_0754639 [Tanacetum coccineum]
MKKCIQGTSRHTLPEILHIPKGPRHHIIMIQSWQSSNKRNNEVMKDWQKVLLRSISWDTFIPWTDTVFITAMITNYKVSRIYMDRGRSINLRRGRFGTYSQDTPILRTIMLEFHVVKSSYNVLLGRTVIQKLSMEVSSIWSIVEFPTSEGITRVKSNYPGREEILAALVDGTRTSEI